MDLQEIEIHGYILTRTYTHNGEIKLGSEILLDLYAKGQLSKNATPNDEVEYARFLEHLGDLRTITSTSQILCG